MKIVFMNSKGGTGKTTVSLLTAACYALSGNKIFVKDCDPQNSAVDFLASLNVPNICAVGGEDADEKKSVYGVTIYDTPPSLNYPGVEKVVKGADRIIIVTTPSPTDIAATTKTEHFLKSHKAEGKARILFNRVETGNTVFENLDNTKGFFSIPCLKNYLPKRVAYQRFLAEGFGDSAFAVVRGEEKKVVAVVGAEFRLADLKVRGQLALKTSRGAEAYELMKMGALSGMSIGYRTRDDSYDRVTGVRSLKKVDLVELSLVTFPMNDSSRVSAVKPIEELDSLSEIERHLRDACGMSKSEALAMVSRVKSVISRSDSGDREPLAELSAALKARAVF